MYFISSPSNSSKIIFGVGGMVEPWRNTLAKSKQNAAGLSLSHTTDRTKNKKITGCREGMVAPSGNTPAKSKRNAAGLSLTHTTNRTKNKKIRLYGAWWHPEEIP